MSPMLIPMFFSRLSSVVCFPALGTSYILSRDWYRLQRNPTSDLVLSTFEVNIITRVDIFVENHERKPRIACFSPSWDFSNQGFNNTLRLGIILLPFIFSCYLKTSTALTLTDWLGKLLPKQRDLYRGTSHKVSVASVW